MLSLYFIPSFIKLNFVALVLLGPFSFKYPPHPPPLGASLSLNWSPVVLVSLFQLSLSLLGCGSTHHSVCQVQSNVSGTPLKYFMLSPCFPQNCLSLSHYYHRSSSLCKSTGWHVPLEGCCYFTLCLLYTTNCRFSSVGAEVCLD